MLSVDQLLDAFEVQIGDCLVAMDDLPEDFFESCVTDPPYHLVPVSNKGSNARGFMGKIWDGGGIAHDPETWRKVLRVCKPGAHLLAFGGTRTFHRLACAIEDAGWEIADCVYWCHAQGFPKSTDVSKQIDKLLGAEREVVGRRVHPTLKNAANVKSRAYHVESLESDSEAESWDITAPASEQAKKWSGWGTSLKPAVEPIILARKPRIGTIAQNVLTHGCGGLNIEACRVPIDPDVDGSQLRVMNRGQRTEDQNGQEWGMSKNGGDVPQVVHHEGRWPANLLHDGSDEVLGFFPEAKGQQGDLNETGRDRPSSGRFGDMGPPRSHAARVETNKSAARFFYTAKAKKSERGIGNNHPTVKPLALMEYLCKLVTPPGGRILDPFMGSGTTGLAALPQGFQFYGIEQDPVSYFTAKARILRSIDPELLT